MAVALLSDAERLFTVHGIQDNLRNDGRSCQDFRYIELETDILSSTNGSAKVIVGNTFVLVGVKTDIVEPKEDRPNEGYVKFFVDFSANAAPEFEGRGGDDIAALFSSVLSAAFNHPSSLDYRSLCLVPRQQCWLLHVDILILQCGGNLLDVVSIATKAALANTKIPAVTVTTSEHGKPQLELSDDPGDVVRLDVSSVPVIVTVSKVGYSHIVDATQDEEACVLARLYTGVDRAGAITCLRQNGSGSLDTHSVSEMIETAKTVGVKVHQALEQALDQVLQSAAGQTHSTGYIA